MEFVADALGNYEIIFVVFITVASGTSRLGAGAFCGKLHANSQKVSALHLL